MRDRPFFPYLVLLTGVLIASTAAIMINQAITLGAHPLTISAGRVALAALILTPIAWGTKGAELRRIERRDWGLGFLAGAFLAVHFATWISSLAYTSVASSTALVTTNPVFVALISWLIFREKLSWGVWMGVLLTVCGSMLVGFSDSAGGSGSNPLLGDLLALLGAMTVTGYFLIGRSVRNRLSLLPYIWLVYSSTGLVLLVWMALIGQTLFGLSPLVYLLLLGLAIGPQLLGHTAFNWAIKYLSATFVTVAILGEPIGATIIALFVLDQPLQPLQILGGAVLLVGIGVATLAERQRPAAAVEVAEVEAVVAP
ncbi:MAG TPA: DMT family transporter [Herpetosiphonaceae bacterium]